MPKLISPKDLHQLDRPREKLLAKGEAALQDVELWQIILGSGGKGRNVTELAVDVASLLLKGQLTKEKLLQLSGIKQGQTTRVLAVQELIRRWYAQPVGIINKLQDVWPYIESLSSKSKEHLVILSLNGSHQVINTRVIGVGTLNATLIHPREVFADAILDHAACILIAHNHPSGDVQPSIADRQVTDLLKQAGEILGIPLLDHVIFNRGGEMFSFAEEADF